ncbi:MAG: tRNA (adenosine(37)-N6)-threonylcarbamoyltransferase complex dimerization subunit type 1 TsaB [Gammaproteobacteria bacterium]|nr:tRNA (adenosine(37)-N6)-threonylcarbamoyltransferase complex dimerization subunit type 1 TsaB [Gammaproteobacteria bacterium]
MKLLALDTATEACSAALYIDGEIYQDFQLAPREHTRLILRQAEGLLNKAGITVQQLDALAFGRGPGSFTGVRIATGVVQGMAFGADIPVVPVSTLASIAQAVYEDHQAQHVLSAIDARMGGVYWGQYQLNAEGLMQLVGDEAVLSPADVAMPASFDWCGAGSGWQAHGKILQQRLASVTRIYPDYYPQSKTIARLAVAGFKNGEAVDAAQAIPVYLRNDVAQKSADRK